MNWSSSVFKFKKKSFKKKSNEEKIIELLESIDKRLSSLELCVKSNTHSYGDGYTLSTRHWND